MDDVARVHVQNRIQQLVHDVPLMEILQHCFTLNDVVQVALHVLERQINVHVVGCPVHAVELNDIRVVAEGAQEHDFAEGALGVGFIAKSVEYLLDSHQFGRVPIHGLPNNSIGTSAKSLKEEGDKV